VLKRILIGLVSVAVIGGVGAYFNQDRKNCNSLVDTANSAIDVFNTQSQATTPDLTAVTTKFTSSAAKLRADGKDFKSPFKGEATGLASDLDAIVKAINDQNETGVDGGIDKYNLDIAAINKDCKAKS
jgi:hypothetical protein